MKPLKLGVQTKDELTASQAAVIRELRETVDINKRACEQYKRDVWDVKAENASLLVRLEERDEVIAGLVKVIAKLGGGAE